MSAADRFSRADSRSRTASGSRDSDNGVKPTASQNNTEHTRRSATGPSVPAADDSPDDINDPGLAPASA